MNLIKPYEKNIDRAEKEARRLFREYVQAAKSGSALEYQRTYKAWAEQCDYVTFLVRLLSLVKK